MTHKQKLTSLKVGEKIENLPSDDYVTMCGTRQRLKTKSDYKDWHWQFKLGKGVMSITRTR